MYSREREREREKDWYKVSLLLFIFFVLIITTESSSVQVVDLHLETRSVTVFAVLSLCQSNYWPSFSLEWRMNCHPSLPPTFCMKLLLYPWYSIVVTFVLFDRWAWEVESWVFHENVLRTRKEGLMIWGDHHRETPFSCPHREMNDREREGSILASCFLFSNIRIKVTLLCVVSVWLCLFFIISLRWQTCQWNLFAVQLFREDLTSCILLEILPKKYCEEKGKQNQLQTGWHGDTQRLSLE